MSIKSTKKSLADRRRSVGPVERVCKHSVVLINESANAVFEIFDAGIAFSAQQLTIDDAEPYFNLVHPRTMLWRIQESYPVGHVRQESDSALFVMKDPVFTLFSEIAGEPDLSGNVRYQ